MYSEPVRREAMERARDSGLPALSGKVTLVQEFGPEVQAGFLIYLPIYANGVTPVTVDARREALGLLDTCGTRGFILSPGCTIPTQTPHYALQAIRDTCRAPQ